MSIANLRGQAQVLKTDTINCQASVIKLQGELLATKDELGSSSDIRGKFCEVCTGIY